jgi:hypothetical protein
MTEFAPEPPAEANPSLFGVADMNFEDLSARVAEVYEQWEEYDQAGNLITPAPSYVLGRELIEAAHNNPEKGKELFRAMAKSDRPDDRQFVVARLAEGLMSVDWLLTTSLYADLLVDSDLDVDLAAGMALRDDAAAGRLSAVQAASIARNVSLAVRAYMPEER